MNNEALGASAVPPGLGKKEQTHDACDDDDDNEEWEYVLLRIPEMDDHRDDTLRLTHAQLNFTGIDTAAPLLKLVGGQHLHADPLHATMGGGGSLFVEALERQRQNLNQPSSSSSVASPVAVDADAAAATQTAEPSNNNQLPKLASRLREYTCEWLPAPCSLVCVAFREQAALRESGETAPALLGEDDRDDRFSARKRQQPLPEEEVVGAAEHIVEVSAWGAKKSHRSDVPRRDREHPLAGGGRIAPSIVETIVPLPAAEGGMASSSNERRPPPPLRDAAAGLQQQQEEVPTQAESERQHQLGRHHHPQQDSRRTRVLHCAVQPSRILVARLDAEATVAAAGLIQPKRCV